MKQKMMAQGVPPEEIAFIHDAKTEVQKAELFAKVRKGQVRGLTLPAAYNTGGYETVETVKALAGYVDIWLADYKYASPALAKELSAAQDYPQVAHAAIRQMLLQTGAPVYDADGYLQKGVIVRHLALPGHSDVALPLEVLFMPLLVK
jgi:putative pyruvate formate lyase activating enzyme